MTESLVKKKGYGIKEKVRNAECWSNMDNLTKSKRMIERQARSQKKLV